MTGEEEGFCTTVVCFGNKKVLVYNVLGGTGKRREVLAYNVSGGIGIQSPGADHFFLV